MTSQSKPDGFAGSPNRGNDFDRRQWRKQGEIVGAAASGMQTKVKQPLGAATRGAEHPLGAATRGAEHPLAYRTGSRRMNRMFDLGSNRALLDRADRMKEKG